MSIIKCCYCVACVVLCLLQPLPLLSDLLLHLSAFWSPLWGTFVSWMSLRTSCLQVRAAESGDGITVLAPVLWCGFTWQVVSSLRHKKEPLSYPGFRLEGTRQACSASNPSCGLQSLSEHPRQLSCLPPGVHPTLGQAAHRIWEL